jgi:hypothetical protein
MKTIAYILVAMSVFAGITLADGKKNSSSARKTPQQGTNVNATQTSSAGKPKHPPLAITSSNFKSMDVNHDNRVSREEFAGSTMGKQHPELTNKIFDKSRAKDKSLTVQEIRDRMTELNKDSAEHAKF